MSDFIGAGERTVEKIAKMLFPKKWDLVTQIHIKHLIKKQDYDFLDEVYQKHKVDFAIKMTVPYRKNWVIDKYFGVIRVQGRDHTSGDHGISHGDKSIKDKNHKKLFQDNKLWVVDILFNECPNIFKEQLNWDSVIEFCNMMKMAGVKF